MTDNPLERIKQLEQERTLLIASAKKEALARANSAIADLTALGFAYQLVEERTGRRRKSAAPVIRAGTRPAKKGPCPICKFETDPSHDGRQHRSQGKRKRAFTAEDLKELGLAKV